ncbi:MULTISPECIES: T9SS-dependent choice-of-anchor J family protein [unclassified Kaistella]|uniref:T9SS-dependent choice-of-anchor J family protein n=1 Tax=unclassified Kaistella TaxID=2762626 RepID=UPI002737533C|nr:MULTISPECIES: choice-of-anchor J domain-containing protein [unclassified Kaistella]MDP2453941.1 choice-of-anchor J domain-containing protein [Kaistella sp. SH11-4b]MDP2456998.1 choice-of-anchor J domain-containing protein [Kaistella sp. SH40-3]MDP2459755.1 choice-of-anchor J domain-containing protein [Kaistella sp. SH19-2b]
MIKKLLLASALGLGAFYFGQTVVFKEDFNQDSTRSLWTIGDRDGDEDTWEFVNAAEAEAPSFTGDFAWSWSWFFGAMTPDNTITSPKISIPATGNLELSFKVSAADDEEGFFEEHYAVYVIPFDSEFTGSETPVFEETLDGGYFQTAKLVKVDISSFAGQDVKLVFRHYDCTDILYLGLDDVEITQTLLAVSDSQKSQVSIYPNPTSDFIKIQNIKDLQKVRIFDMTGKKVIETTSSDIDVLNLSAGQYILNIYSGNEVISRKFIKK